MYVWDRQEGKEWHLAVSKLSFYNHLEPVTTCYQTKQKRVHQCPGHKDLLPEAQSISTLRQHCKGEEISKINTSSLSTDNWLALHWSWIEDIIRQSLTPISLISADQVLGFCRLRAHCVRVIDAVQFEMNLIFEHPDNDHLILKHELKTA